MAIEIRYFENREDWRKWLIDNFETTDEIWFVFPTQSSGKKSIPYNDVVEAHTRKLIKKGSFGYWKKNMVHPILKDKISSVLSDSFVFPTDIIDSLKEDETVWNNYQYFSLVSFSVDNVDETYAVLKEKSVIFVNEPTDMPD